MKNVKTIKKNPENKKNSKKVTDKKGLPKITILHTGGTIASKVDYETGGVVASFSSEDLIDMFPDLREIANIQSRNVMSMMSEDVGFSQYKILSQEIQKEIKKGVIGIIIGHGTDTLALTSTALSFMLENLPIPVILVGSQRSTDRGSTDAKQNLLCAAYFITKTDFTGVGICMHGSSNDDFCDILPSTKTKKLHTSRRDAFKAVNDKPIARVDYKNKKIDYLKKYSTNSKEKLNVKEIFEDKIGIVKTYPNMTSDLINCMTENKYKGFVLEGSGIGQAPTNTKENIANYESIKKFIDKGGIVVLTSNCVFGEVHSEIYKNTRRLKEIGVIFGKDMLTETAYIKLAWLMGNYSKEEAKELLTTNMRGEITERRLFKEKFI